MEARIMDHVDSNGIDLDLDIDLESGETTSEEEANKAPSVSSLGGKNKAFPRLDAVCASTSGRECSYSYNKLLISDEVLAKNNEENLRETTVNTIDKTTADRKKPKKQKSSRPPKPPRPPVGPALGACDMILLKEISDLNLKRKTRERINNLKKVKKEKKPSSLSNLFACLVTIVFFLVIVFHGIILILGFSFIWLKLKSYVCVC